MYQVEAANAPDDADKRRRVDDQFPMPGTGFERCLAASARCVRPLDLMTSATGGKAGRRQAHCLGDNARIQRRGERVPFLSALAPAIEFEYRQTFTEGTSKYSALPEPRLDKSDTR